MSNLTISVLIPTYGRDEELCQTLRQLLAQDLAPDEILVVDQTPEHSTDTRVFLENLVNDGRIRLVQQVRPSASRARNRAILEASGDILIFLDDDVLIETDFIRAHAANYQDPAVAGVSGAIWSEAGRPLSTIRELPPRKKGPLAWMEVPANLSFRTDKKISMMAGNCSVRRSVALQIGGFDENYGRFDYHADYDFGWRVSRTGGKILFEPRAGIHHLAAPRGGCRVTRKNKIVPEVEELRPKFYFYCKNFPTYHSLLPFCRLLRQHVFNRPNLRQPQYLLLGLIRTVVALGKAIWDAAVIGERSSVKVAVDSGLLPASSNSGDDRDPPRRSSLKMTK